MRLLLDTQVWLWMHLAPERLRPDVRVNAQQLHDALHERGPTTPTSSSTSSVAPSRR